MDTWTPACKPSSKVDWRLYTTLKKMLSTDWILWRLQLSQNDNNETNGPIKHDVSSGSPDGGTGGEVVSTTADLFVMERTPIQVSWYLYARCVRIHATTVHNRSASVPYVTCEASVHADNFAVRSAPLLQDRRKTFYFYYLWHVCTTFYFFILSTFLLFF